LGQGQVFNSDVINIVCTCQVAIPLGQGQVFNDTSQIQLVQLTGRNPFGSGTGF